MCLAFILVTSLVSDIVVVVFFFPHCISQKTVWRWDFLGECSFCLFIQMQEIIAATNKYVHH